MCETRAIGRPGWGWLYGTTLPPLAALTLVEAVMPPNVLRTVLRYALAMATVAGMALWIRAHRVAIDLQNWCDCAASTITVRVIESRRPASVDRSDPIEPRPAAAEEDCEPVAR